MSTASREALGCASSTGGRRRGTGGSVSCATRTNSALVEAPPAKHITSIRGRSALRDQTSSPGFEREDALDPLMFGGLDMDVRDGNEDLVENASPEKGFEDHHPSLTVQVAHAEF